MVWGKKQIQCSAMVDHTLMVDKNYYTKVSKYHCTPTVDKHNYTPTVDKLRLALPSDTRVCLSCLLALHYFCDR